MNRKIKKQYILKKSIKRKINKILGTTIIFLIGMILIKNNDSNKSFIKENIYEKNIPFLKIKKVYEKYFGNLLSIEKEKKETQPVFKESIAYLEKENVENGIKLKVENHYLVPTLESGIIVYLGKKGIYDNAIVVEQINGIETTYANIEIVNFKLYDYLEKGETLGEVQKDELILMFQKDGEYIDYQTNI